MPAVVVFEIDGLVWREAVAYGMHGWNGDPFWDMQGDTLTATGTVLLDTTHFYRHYFLDVDNDSIPEYRLGFGPPWYEPESGATRPEGGVVVSVFGRVQDFPGLDMLAVYAIDGLQWRPLDAPAPWAGAWMHRGHSDTTFVFCVTDSASWLGFGPGHMGGHGGMGGMMWPASAFAQFWQILPDSLPGGHQSEHFMGFYLNVHEPSGNSMMDGRFGGRHGGMRFQRENRLRFHYEDEDLSQNGLLEQTLVIRFWDQDANAWQEVSHFTLDNDANTITFVREDLSNYYALYASSSATDVDDERESLLPSHFVLHQNYPNPFNPSTTIRFELPARSVVALTIYNLLGQPVKQLLNEARAAGAHAIQWHGRDEAGRSLASGVYLMRLKVGSEVRTRAMTLLK